MNCRDTELPAASVAVMVTVVVPFGKLEPDAGLLVTFAFEQLSVAAGKVNVTTAEQLPGSVFALMFGDGLVKFGGVVSMTVKTTVSELLCPQLSTAVTVTVCGPGPTSVPAAGFCESAALPLTPDVVVAAR